MIFLKTRYIFTEIKQISEIVSFAFFLHIKFFIFTIAHVVPFVEFCFISPDRLDECFRTKS